MREKNFFIFLRICLLVFPSMLLAQNNAPILYSTTEIVKEGDKCKIGQDPPVPWIGSPCEKMYGPLH